MLSNPVNFLSDLVNFFLTEAKLQKFCEILLPSQLQDSLACYRLLLPSR